MTGTTCGFVEVSRGVPAKRVDIVYRDLRKPGGRSSRFWCGDFDSRFSANYANGEWYVQTDYMAPKGRILKAMPAIAPEAGPSIVPEGQDVIDGSNIVGGKLFGHRLHDVKSETSV